MHPFISVFQTDVPLYGLFLLGGALLAALSAWLLLRLRKEQRYANFFPAVFFTLPFAVLGSIIFKPVLNLLALPFNPEKYAGLELPEIFESLFGEVVFYGAALGAIFGLVLFCLFFRLPALPLFDLGATVLVLGHAFGRIGCYFGGCCYGAETEADSPFAIIYPPYPLAGYEGLTAPPGIPLINVPGLEAAFLFLLFAVLVVCYLKGNVDGRCFLVYLGSYGSWRFVIEFFRGDALRGIYGPLSVSQYVSLLLLLLMVGVAFYVARQCAKSSQNGSTQCQRPTS